MLLVFLVSCEFCCCSYPSFPCIGVQIVWIVCCVCTQNLGCLIDAFLFLMFQLALATPGPHLAARYAPASTKHLAVRCMQGDSPTRHQPVPVPRFAALEIDNMCRCQPRPVLFAVFCQPADCRRVKHMPISCLQAQCMQSQSCLPMVPVS